MWIIIWKNVYDSWSPWPGPRGCFGALSGDGLGAGKARLSRLYLLSGVQGHLGEDPPLEMVNPPSVVG